MEFSEELRPIEIRNGTPMAGKKGFFHGWCKEPFYNESGSYLTKTYALIELTDGNVDFVEPTVIKFTSPHTPKKDY